MKKIRYFIKGIIIGSTMMVPGVSGGTMALVLGIYDELIHAVSSFFKNIKKNITFLSIVISGILIGLVTISFIVDYGLKNFRHPVMFLFLGVVIGGIPVLFKEANVGEKKILDYFYCLVGILIVGLLAVFNNMQNQSLIEFSNINNFIGIMFLFLAGIIIAIALILPGISTSFLLLTLGLYEPMLEAVKTLNFSFLIPILFGVGFGIITTTKILESFLNKKPRQTYLLIIGFVIASIIEVFPGIPQGFDILFSIIAFVLGFFAIRYFSVKYQD